MHGGCRPKQAWKAQELYFWGGPDELAIIPK